MNIPNLLTLLRIILVPLVVIFLMEGAFLKALILFTLSGITDALDGFLARFLNQQTVLGSYLDPIADKALIISCFVTLSVLGFMPGWLSVVVISRDIIILSGTSILTMMSIPFEIHPAFVSKVTTALQLITVIMVLAVRSLPMDFAHSWIVILYWTTALFTIFSGLYYIFKGIRVINHAS